MTAILDADGIVAGYEPGLMIVNGASARLYPGDILAVLGPNGAGKSTLVKALAGLVPVAMGSVTLAGRDITHLAAFRRIGEGLAYVPQSENVFARLSVEDNLDLAGFRLGRAKAGRIEAMWAMFPDLARQRRLPAGRLSGGQRQMLAIARALIVDPTVLLLDEPSAGLSPRLVHEVFAKLEEIRDGGVAIMLVEQNVRAALELADRGLVLVEGRVRHEAPAAELAADPELGGLFMGMAG